MTSDEKPRLIVVGGPNGAGKTSITEQLLAHRWFKGAQYINPDVIARDVFGDWNSPEAIKKAADRADEMRRSCLSARQSFAFETVFSQPDKLEFLREAAERGYFIRLFYISTDGPDINAARITQRVQQGGHSVPIEKIISRYSKSIAQAARALTFVDRGYVYDNSVDGALPALLFRTASGVIRKIYDQPRHDWALPVLDAVRHEPQLFPTP